MCTKPMCRAEKFGERYTTKDGRIAHKIDFFSWEEYEVNPDYFEKKYLKIDMVPCGQCTECRLNYARNWANRVMLEKLDHEENECWFLTLTYDDEHLPTHTTVNEETGEKVEGISLKKEDLQNFMKKLRRYYEYYYHVEGIRFFGCGEYGSAEYTERPHYHICVFGLPLDLTKLKKRKQNAQGQPLWEHEEIQKIWKKGNVIIGRIDWESACYVARYVMKKQKGKNAWIYSAQGKIPPFVNMSRKPGIGSNYAQKNLYQIYETDTIPIANKKTAAMMQPPKAFDRIMEKLEPEFMEELKKERKKKAQSIQRAKNLQTDMTPAQQRKVQEQALQDRTKSLIRKEI